jgi:hypothetical protein
MIKTWGGIVNAFPGGCGGVRSGPSAYTNPSLLLLNIAPCYRPFHLLGAFLCGLSSFRQDIRWQTRPTNPNGRGPLEVWLGVIRNLP